jgi:hypothetical protein
LTRQAATEWLEKEEDAIRANPGMKLVDVVPPEALSRWFSFALIAETKRLRWLTIVLVILTAVLAILAFRLALLRC